MKRFVSLLLCFAMLAAFAGCSGQGGKAEIKVNDTADFEEFIFSGTKAAFDAFMLTEDGKKSSVTSLDALVGSMTFMQIVFDFMKTGKAPQGYKITETEGVYKMEVNRSVMTYKFDVESCSVYYRVESEADIGIDYWSVLTQRKNVYYIQRYVAEYGLLNEISFTANGGSAVAKTVTSEPTPIYAADIPSGFATE